MGKQGQPHSGGARPPPGGATIEDLIARAGERVDQLKAATREANEAAQALKEAAREHQASLKAAAHDAVEELLKHHADVEMARMGEEIKAVTVKVGDQVRRQLDDLLNTYLAGESADEPSLPELVEARQRIRKSREAIDRDRRTSGGKA
jgi:hypothetical protein